MPQPFLPRLHRTAGLVAAAAFLASCGGGGGGGASGIAASAPAASEGALRLAVTDAPGCGFDHVYVTIEKVRLHGDAGAAPTDTGWTDIAMSPPRRVDLLALTNGALQELASTSLPAGRYAQMRLVLAANAPSSGIAANAVVPAGGAGEAPLSLPASAAAGVKVGAGFDVAAGQLTDLVLDIDACRSVASAGTAGWQLRPSVAVLPRSGGGIEGSVAQALAAVPTTLSAQQGGVTVRATRPREDGTFRIPYLPAGTYTLVIASEGRSTGVVTDVPVRSGMTSVSSGTAAIGLPDSAMGEIGGTVGLTVSADGSADVSSASAEAQARATRTLASGEPVEVAARPVDAVSGAYRLAVPRSALVRAAYVPSGALSFSADAAGADAYGIDILTASEALPAQ